MTTTTTSPVYHQTQWHYADCTIQSHIVARDHCVERMVEQIEQLQQGYSVLCKTLRDAQTDNLYWREETRKLQELCNTLTHQLDTISQPTNKGGQQ